LRIRARLRALSRAWVLLAVSVSSACASLEPSAADRLTDRQLLRYATAAYDERKMMFTALSLGIHNGVPVVAEFPCADLCPGHTVRVIRYDLKEGDTCAGARGVEKRQPVPVLIGVVNRTFCFPGVLAEHWTLYTMGAKSRRPHGSVRKVGDQVHVIPIRAEDEEAVP
jgi:hypothetical protein